MLTKTMPVNVRNRIMRSRIRFDESSISNVQFKLADTIEEYVGAARLVHDSYVGRKILNPHPSGLRVNAYTVVPTTLTFVAKIWNDVIGTMSIVFDSELGLPMQAVFKDEIQKIRSKGTKIAEVSALSVESEYRGSGIMYLLMHLMYNTAASLGCDYLTFSVHPKSTGLYEAFLLCEQIGAKRAYPGLNETALAVALALDLKNAPENWVRECSGMPDVIGNAHYFFLKKKWPQIASPVIKGDLLSCPYRIKLGQKLGSLAKRDNPEFKPESTTLWDSIFQPLGARESQQNPTLLGLA